VNWPATTLTWRRLTGRSADYSPRRHGETRWWFLRRSTATCTGLTGFSERAGPKILRQAPIQKANNVIVNNCIVSNFADYGVVYNGSTGGFFGPITVTKSTFYGMGATVFMLQKNSTSISISDCTFDNVVGTSAKAVVDMSTLVTPVTFTNCILGKSTLASGGLTIKTGGTLTITNCYNTTDWTAATPTATAGITGSLTAYSGASTALFTSPTVVTNFPGATQTITTGNYKILDATFAGANSAGDPRWYLNAVQGVKQVLSDKGVSFNGTEIVNKNGLSIEVYSILGKRIATSMTNIPTANFQKGIYIQLGNGFFFRRNQKEPVRVLKVVGKLGWFARIPSSCPEFSKTVSRPASQHFRLFNRITDFRIERRKIDNLAGYEGARDLITCRLPRRGRDWLRPRRLFLSRRLGTPVLESCRA